MPSLKLTERQVTKQIIDFLRAEGWYCIRLQSGLFQRPDGKGRVRIGEPGMADWLALKRGWIPRFLEIKGNGGKPTTIQRTWIANMRRLGFDAGWFDSFESFKSSHLQLVRGQNYG